MAEIRLFKLAKQYNVAASRLVEFLDSKGYSIDNNPNSKVPEDAVPMVAKEFGSEEKARQEAEK
ncbi:MAG: translation initiation factor IF-2 N-terminal domain-containing protein, partial [Bacteroidales bacterium]|nr:translation initiation factor IF-2 N-terminal domain-containing protein [Bacteroidales bacterium]